MSSRKNKPKPIPTIKTGAIPTTIKPADTTDESAIALKEETLRWIFSIICATLVYLVVAYIIQQVYHPDISVLIASAKNVLMDTSAVRPEPMEALLFRSAVVIIIPGTIGFYALFSKLHMVKTLAQQPFFHFFTMLCFLFLIAMIYYDFAAPNPYAAGGTEQPQNSRDFVGKTNFDFFFDGIFLSKYFLVYTFIIVPALACLFLIGFKKFNWEGKALYKKIVLVVGYAVAGGVLLVMILMNIFEFPYTFENKFNFNAAYYSVTQVYAGLPMLVNGFTNTYGLYPHFLNLIFHFTGLSVLKFSTVMSLLLAVAFSFNFFVLKKYTNNKVILFLGFFTVICFPYLDFRFLTSFDSTFAFSPIRFIVPSAGIFLVMLYLNKKSVTLYWVTFVVMALLVLWNPEIGIICYLAWIAFNSYNDFYEAEGKAAIKKILFHWLVGITVFIVTVYTYKLVIFLLYGSFPDLSLLYSTILVFGKVGFNLLPMVLVHPWNITALITLLGFTYSLIIWYKKEITPKASMVFLLSIISLGFFVYFQGRSHNWPFACSTAFSLVLVTILGDELWIKIRNNNVLSLNILFVVFLFILSFSFFDVLSNTDRYSEFVYQENDKEKQADEQKRVETNTDFILKNSQPGEQIYVFSGMYLQGLYFDRNKRRSAFNPGEVDMFLKTEHTRLVNRLRDSSFKVFIEPALSAYHFLLEPIAAIAATYEVKDTTQTMYLLTKQKTRIPTGVFFSQHDNLIHRKYSDDTAGINLRINDAMGSSPVKLNPEFSVEALFYSQSQIYQYASVVGNMDDSSGFLIAKIIKTPYYFFGINGKGISLQAPNNEWIYCVVNVFQDHLEIYENGALAGTLPLPAPMKVSPQKLYIGNGGYLRNYLGPISEVAINNKVLDKDQIQKTWEEIMPIIGKK